MPLTDDPTLSFEGKQDELLEECLALAQSTVDMLPGIQALEAWSEALGKCFPQGRATISDERQERLCITLWEAFEAPQVQVAPLARSALLRLLSALSTGELGLPNARLSRLLLAKSLANAARKKTCGVLECLMDKYGAGFLLQPSLVDGLNGSEVYLRLIQESTGSDTNLKRRSKLGLRLLMESAARAGLEVQNGKLINVEKSKWAIWQQTWLQPLVFILRSSSPRHRHWLGLYHLSQLFVVAPAAMHVLLQALCETNLDEPGTSQEGARPVRAPAVIEVLRSGKDLGLVTTGPQLTFESVPIGSSPKLAAESEPLISVSNDLLRLWAGAANEEVKVGVLALIATSRPAAVPLSASELDVLANLLPSTFDGHSAEYRSLIQDHIHVLLHRIRFSTHAAARLARGGRRHPAWANVSTAPEEAIEDARRFLAGLVSSVALALDVRSSFSTQLSGLAFLEQLLENGIDERLKASIKSATQVEQYPFSIDIANAVLAEKLLAVVQNSTYDDLTRKASTLLLRFPSPLPGIDAEHVEERLLQPIRTLLRGTREWQSVNGVLLLQIYRQHYAGHLSEHHLKLSPGEAKGSTSCIDALKQSLDDSISYAQKNGLEAAANAFPLQGTLFALERFLRIDSLPPGEASALFAALLAAIDSIWAIVTPIICSSAPEGQTASVDERTKAMAMLSLSDNSGDADDELPEEGATPRFQMVLTYAWRSIEAAANLLCTIASTALTTSAPKATWSEAELDSVGQRFINWLTSIRHRGAFSAIIPAYRLLAARLLKHKDSTINSLPDTWLQGFISHIADPASPLSITRRSAGIGHSVTALLGAAPRDFERVSRYVSKLVALSEADSWASSSNPATTSIHAFNTLRCILTDGAMADATRPHLPDLIKLSISRFSAPQWSLRNAALMLYSTVCTRIFGLRQVNQRGDPLSLSFRQFTTRLPGVHTFLQEQIVLCVNAAGQKGADVNARTSLFAILVLLSKFRPAIGGEVEEATHLAVAVESCLGDTSWKIREMAAAALAAIVPPSRSIEYASRLVQQDVERSNAQHGLWLAVAKLLDNASFAEANLAATMPDAILQAASRTASDSAAHPAVRATCQAIANGSASSEVLAPSLQMGNNSARTPTDVISALRTASSTSDFENLLLASDDAAMRDSPQQGRMIQIIFASTHEAEVSATICYHGDRVHAC